MSGRVIAVCASPEHGFSKQVRPDIDLVEGIGIEGDTHSGVTVQHRSRVARDPTQPNLRQVHLIHAELFSELAAKGFELDPGAIGENIVTQQIDLLALSTGTRLQVGRSAVIELTGLRNPCIQLDRFAPGLMSALIDRDENGALVRKGGVMAIVVKSGRIRPGDAVLNLTPDLLHRPLLPV